MAKLADKLADCVNPDGQFSDEPNRARRRGLSLRPQDHDGMSALEAVLAKLAAPGMADPYSEHPSLDGHHRRKPSTALPAAQRNATTTDCTRDLE